MLAIAWTLLPPCDQTQNNTYFCLWQFYLAFIFIFSVFIIVILWCDFVFIIILNNSAIALFFISVLCFIIVVVLFCFVLFICILNPVGWISVYLFFYNIKVNMIVLNSSRGVKLLKWLDYLEIMS